ncbi:MAG: hypothetical protein ACLUEQ_12565 [Cloacibacillus evryensis]
MTHAVFQHLIHNGGHVIESPVPTGSSSSIVLTKPQRRIPAGCRL